MTDTNDNIMQKVTIDNYEILKENIKKELTQDEYNHILNIVRHIDFKGGYEKKCLTLYLSYMQLKQSK